jgi:hypothetical protein
MARMYRKDSARHIVRDVRKRLTDMRRTIAWSDWRMALIASQDAHPEWYRHSEPLEKIETLLREAGIDMSEPEAPYDFVGSLASDA